MTRHGVSAGSQYVCDLAEQAVGLISSFIIIMIINIYVLIDYYLFVKFIISNSFINIYYCIFLKEDSKMINY